MPQFIHTFVGEIFALVNQLQELFLNMRFHVHALKTYVPLDHCLRFIRAWCLQDRRFVDRSRKRKRFDEMPGPYHIERYANRRAQPVRRQRRKLNLLDLKMGGGYGK